MRTSLAIACGVGVLQLAMLVVGAYLDGTLWLPGPAVGLFEHSGMFSVLAGDVALFVICTVAGKMTCKIGRKLPSLKPDLTRRYFRVFVANRLFGHRGIFYRFFFFLAVVGAMALVSQSVMLFRSEAYYGHDTFGSDDHPYSFVASRINLFTSWCLIIPLFFSYLLCHSIAIRTLLRKAAQHRLAYFHKGHPDRCGGYSFFGWIDTLYALGILTVLLEVLLMIVTHQRLTLGNVLAFAGLVFGALVISIFSINETMRLLRQQERMLKLSFYTRNRRRSPDNTVESAVLTFGLKFSPYTSTAFKLAIGLRILIAVPAVYRVVQYFSPAA